MYTPNFFEALAKPFSKSLGKTASLAHFQNLANQKVCEATQISDLHGVDKKRLSKGFENRKLVNFFLRLKKKSKKLNNLALGNFRFSSYWFFSNLKCLTGIKALSNFLYLLFRFGLIEFLLFLLFLRL